MAKPLIKIYGERNTGTNYLSKLIELNLQVIELPGVLPPRIRKLKRLLPEEFVIDTYFRLTCHKNLGWKHTRVQSAAILSNYSVCTDDVHFITLTKNPYSWLLSLHKRPYHQQSSRNLTFEKFLKSEWKTVRRENSPRVLESPIELWNVKNKSYLQLGQSFQTINAKFENLLRTPESLIENIRKSFSCPQKLSEFTNIHQSAKGHDRDSAYYRKFYLNEEWRNGLSPQSIEFINQRLDQKLMSHFEYDILDTRNTK